MRKTSIDIPAYIAEGCGKPNDAEFSKSIGAAVGFANRLDYYALMAFDLEMIDKIAYDKLQDEIVEVRKMLTGFSRRLV